MDRPQGLTGRALSLAVVGADYPNKRGPGRRFEIALCRPGDIIDLILEPRNKADRNAVAVFSERGVQIGYVTAERAPWIGSMIRDGRDVTAIFQQPTAYGAVIRVGIDVEPTLPADASESQSSDGRDDDTGFWPDPVWPD